MCAVSPDALHHAGRCVGVGVCVCVSGGGCDPECHPRDRTVPGGPGMWCQRQVPGGHRLNNASCPALALAGAPLWSVPETSVAGVFNHLACTSLLPINPSPPLLHSLHPSLPLFPAKQLMRSLLSLRLSLCVCVCVCQPVFMCVFTRVNPQSHHAAKIQSTG